MKTIRNKTGIEIEIDGKIYQFLCDSDCGIGAVHDAIMQMRAYVLSRIQESVPEEKSEPAPEQA